MKFDLSFFIKNLRQFFIIKKSGLFDVDYYQNTYPEVKTQRINPIMHYIKFGWREGKNPSPDFDTQYYIRENKDVRFYRINPLIHFIQFGQGEERPTNRSLCKDPYTYSAWIDQYDTLTPADRSAICSHIDTFKHQPLISILMPVYNTPGQFLREALDSLLAQLYSNWECCIADDASTDPDIRKILEAYALKDLRIKVTYRETHGSISAASNTALSMASGVFIGLLEPDDVLREHALYMILNEINRYPQAEVIYSDEDLIDDFSVRYDPYFKPDWNPDLFYGQNLITHFGVYRTDKVRKVGGFREGYEGAQDWDLAMRVSEKVPSACIRHIPFVLYHWRALIDPRDLSLTLKTFSQEAQFKTLQSHFERMCHHVEMSYTDDDHWKIKRCIEDPIPLVSIIIPTRNQSQFLQKCLNSIQTKTHYPNYEILVVNNQSDDNQTLNFLEQLEKDRGISLLNYDHPFNYSAINNLAAYHARGEVLVFLNNDIEVISPEWLDEMVGHAIRPEIGAVGALLYYPEDEIQHAGVVLGLFGIAGHIYLKQLRGFQGQRGRARLTQNYSAVTGACMAIEKRKFDAVSGFDADNLPVTFNDIDLCIRLMNKGYRNLWTPHAELYHHESITRGPDDTPTKKARFISEITYMEETWGDILMNDPAYNPNLSLQHFEVSLAFPPRTIKPWSDNG